MTNAERAVTGLTLKPAKCQNQNTELSLIWAGLGLIDQEAHAPHCPCYRSWFRATAQMPRMRLARNAYVQTGQYSLVLPTVYVHNAGPTGEARYRCGATARADQSNVYRAGASPSPTTQTAERDGVKFQYWDLIEGIQQRKRDFNLG